MSSNFRKSESEEEEKEEPTSKFDRTSYMRDYMRDYRQKQKQKIEERSHMVKFGNQLVKEEEAMSLLTQAINGYVEIINDNIEHISADRLELINELSSNPIKYGQMLLRTFEELRNRFKHQY